MPKISGLPAAGSANTSDQLPANQSGTTRRVTVSQIVAVPKAIETITGTANYVAAFDGSGNGTSLSSLQINSEGGLSQLVTAVPVNSGGGYKTLHSDYGSFNPTVVDADDNWYHRFIEASVGDDDSGNQLGDGSNGGLTAFGVNVRSIQSSSVGNLGAMSAGATIGNGTSPISARSMTVFTGNLSLGDDSDCEDVYGLNIGFGQSATSSVINNNFYGSNFGGTLRNITANAYLWNFAVQVLSANQINGINYSPTIEDTVGSVIGYSDFTTQNTGGVVGNNYFSGALQPSIRSITGGYWGLNIAPTVDDCDYAYGIQIDMSNVTSSGSVKALSVTGDVDVIGNFSFTGTLSIGQLNAFYSAAAVDGGGTPTSLHGLISSVTAAASVTVANADMIGVNTACLIDIGDNATLTSGPFGLGIAALALPAIVKIGDGASIGNVHGAVFALSLDPTSGNGTFAQVAGCRAVTIPQGGDQQITRLYGYHADLFAGDPGDDSWGLYIEDHNQNFLEAGLKIGGTPGSSDTTSHKLEVEGSALFDGSLGFYGTTPIAQPSSSGVATASGTYGATEQAMLQEAYNALRALGLMS
jgi:hypothetical protein